MSESEQLTRNAAQCLDCNDIIESRYTHDFKYCKCGKIFVDGGLDYMRYGFTERDKIKLLAEYGEGQ